MSPIRPEQEAHAWSGDNMLDRANKCAGFLYCHDFVTDAERTAIHMRIQKWIAKHRPIEGAPGDTE